MSGWRRQVEQVKPANATMAKRRIFINDFQKVLQFLCAIIIIYLCCDVVFVALETVQLLFMGAGLRVFNPYSAVVIIVPHRITVSVIALQIVHWI